MKPQILVAVISLLLLSASLGFAAEPLESIGLYQWIEKGTRYGYVGNFPMHHTVMSKQELDSIRVAIDRGGPSMIRSKAASQFTSIFDSTKINFEQESLALLLLRQTSGSNKVTTGEPTFDGDTLHIPIEVIYPQFGSADMAYYIYALKVKKSVVKIVWLDVVHKIEDNDK